MGDKLVCFTDVLDESVVEVNDTDLESEGKEREGLMLTAFLADMVRRGGG